MLNPVSRFRTATLSSFFSFHFPQLYILHNVIDHVDENTRALISLQAYHILSEQKDILVDSNNTVLFLPIPPPLSF
jgi:hypothetical protein